MKIEIDIKKEKLIWILVIVLNVAILLTAFVVGEKLGSKLIKTHVEKYDLSPESKLEVMLVKYKFINTRESGKNKNLRVTECHAEIPFFVNVKSVIRSEDKVTCVASLTIDKPFIKEQKVIAEVEKSRNGGSESEGVRKGIEEDKELKEVILKEIRSDFLLMDEAKKQACDLLEKCIKKVNTNEEIQVLFEEQNEWKKTIN